MQFVEKSVKIRTTKLKRSIIMAKSTFWAEFKKFITRGNVLDMSVGVIVGGAFTAIVNGMSNYVLKPIVNWMLALVFGADSLSGIYTYLKIVKKDVLDEAGAVIGQEIDLAQSIFLDWGFLISSSPHWCCSPSSSSSTSFVRSRPSLERKSFPASRSRSFVRTA